MSRCTLWLSCLSFLGFIEVFSVCLCPSWFKGKFGLLSVASVFQTSGLLLHRMHSDANSILAGALAARLKLKHCDFFTQTKNTRRTLAASAPASNDNSSVPDPAGCPLLVLFSLFPASLSAKSAAHRPHVFLIYLSIRLSIYSIHLSRFIYPSTPACIALSCLPIYLAI